MTMHDTPYNTYRYTILKTFTPLLTSSSAITEGLHNALSHNCTKNHIWLEGLPFHVV